jgi:uncharacterized protein YaeQ
MALSATVRRFEIELADSDRGVYESFELRAAQHPSETDRYLVARVLARCLEHDEGVEFGRGVSADDEPAIWRRDLRGDLLAWIDVGSPSPDRLHKASKTGARVAVYGWQRVDELARAIEERGVHRRDALELHELDVKALDALVEHLDRTNRWSVAVSGGVVYVTVGAELVEVSVRDVRAG